MALFQQRRPARATEPGPGRVALERCSLALLLGLSLADCSMLPAAAPTTVELKNSLNDSEVEYNLVNVDERVAGILHEYRGPTFGARYKNNHYRPDNALRPGDIIGITIFEIGSAGSAPGSTTSVQQAGSFSGPTTVIPPQIIEKDGTIMLPFVGRIKAAGRNPGQLGQQIQKLLEGKAVEPQVIVTLNTSVANVATVGGDVGSPRPVPLSLRGERLLDVIATAGGTKHEAYDEYVSVVRKGHVETVLLQTIVTNSAENIVVQPNDQVYLTYYPRTFAVLGAAAKVSQYTFDTAKVTLAEAVARAGGPVDTTGDPAGIYLFRYEPAFIAEKVLGKEVAVSALAEAKPGEAQLVSKTPNFVPILYRVDFRAAAGYFLSQDIEMRDKDVVLLTNAEGTQLQKLLTAVRGFTGIAYDLARQGQ
jgi:polysaccharide export outer membrane protein